MTPKRDRDRVMAEITLPHLLRLANEHGCPVSREQALAFLNQHGRAYEMWKHMMQAGEDFIVRSLWGADSLPPSDTLAAAYRWPHAGTPARPASVGSILDRSRNQRPTPAGAPRPQSDLATIGLVPSPACFGDGSPDDASHVVQPKSQAMSDEMQARLRTFKVSERPIASRCDGDHSVGINRGSDSFGQHPSVVGI
jgi:hypothetical protein